MYSQPYGIDLISGFLSIELGAFGYDEYGQGKHVYDRLEEEEVEVDESG